MFKRKKNEQEVVEMEQMETAEKSPLDEWEDSDSLQDDLGEKPKKHFFFRREKGENPEKEPLTPEQKKKRRKRLIIGGIVDSGVEYYTKAVCTGGSACGECG